MKSGLIALNGEAGFQPDVLRGGLHFFAPFQYRVHKMPLVTIPQGKIGYVFARDGQPLPPDADAGRQRRAPTTSRTPRAFLTSGGQRGPQRKILREGTYAINLAQFVVHDRRADSTTCRSTSTRRTCFDKMRELIAERGGFAPVVIKGADDRVGIVTVHDGPSLPPGEIIAPDGRRRPAPTPATYHNNFQDPERFLAAGGLRGRQLQVLVEGTYYINRLFATVELIPKTVIEVGNVGVVVSYTGDAGPATSRATEYKHGELVDDGRARRLERAAAARQVRLQHLRRQGDHRCRRRTSS